MKKLVSVFLALLMLFSLCSVAASAEEEKLIITVANDLHYNRRYQQTAKVANKVNEEFAHVGSSTRLPHEAYAIVDSFLRDVAANESNYILIPGDITDAGSAEEVADITALFRKLESETGKKIFVVPGNHDVLKRSIAQFKEDYAEFGYNEALTVDPDSGSYTVDLADGYRLIAIDSTVPGTGKHSLDEKKLQWIAEQGKKAKEDGKKLIGMHHHNFIEHMILTHLLHPNSIVSANNDEVGEVYAQAGIKYMFTAHTHDHDIASYTAADGTVIYDAVTGSLNGIGSPYRVVTFGSEVKFETRHVTKIDTSLLPEGISDYAVALAESDFYKYQEIATDLSYTILFNHYTTAKGLKGVLKLQDEEMNAIIDKVGNRLNEALNMPFEKADETEEGKSIEAIVKRYDTTVPDTDYKNMIDLAVTFYQAANEGDENFPAYSDEIILATRGLGAVLGYTLEEVSGKEYAKVLSFLSGLLAVEIPVDFLTYAGDGIKRFEGIEIFVTTAILPIIADFTTDNAPGDCNVVLPGYAELVENQEESFLQKVINFFKMIYSTVRTLLAFLPEWK